jgi:solute carrier family 25 uncoupling protein 8/9
VGGRALVEAASLDLHRTACAPAGGDKYSGPMACAFDVLRTDGPAGFFKGWAANFARLGPQTVITFIVCERIRSVLGMKSL